MSAPPSLPSTMRAAVHTAYGPPEVVHLMDVPVPTPGAGELLVKVHATTVNRTDSGFRTGKPLIVRPYAGFLRPKRTRPGCEYAGTVAALGTGVQRFSVGDRVFGFTEDDRFGAHAEYVCVNAEGAVALQPEGHDHAACAPLCEGAHYALCDLRAADVGPGQQVLVNGATGAIGSAAVQLARHLGATVTAVADTLNMALVRSLGATTVIDRLKEDFIQSKERFDLVFDAVGKSCFGRCKPLLKPKGIYLSTELGPWLQNPLLAMLTPLLGGKRVLFPVPKITQADAELFASLAAAGSYRPVIDRCYPLEQIVEAHRYVDSGEKVGNVVVVV